MAITKLIKKHFYLLNFGLYVLFNNALILILFGLPIGRYRPYLVGWVCKVYDDDSYINSRYFYAAFCFIISKVVLLPLIIYLLKKPKTLRFYIFSFLLYDFINIVLYLIDLEKSRIYGLFFSNSFLFVHSVKLHLPQVLPALYGLFVVAVAWLFFAKENNVPIRTIGYSIASLLLFFLAFIAHNLLFFQHV